MLRDRSVRSVINLFYLFWALGFCADRVWAKDLTHRLGIGYANNFSVDVPSLAAKYHLNQELALGAALGIDTKKDQSRFGAAARLERTIFVEDNLNFYGGASAGSVSHQVDGNTFSGFELAAFVGCEFFLPGLDSLGIMFEAGVGVTNDNEGTRFRTIADSPLRAGMIFYF